MIKFFSIFFATIVTIIGLLTMSIRVSASVPPQIESPYPQYSGQYIDWSRMDMDEPFSQRLAVCPVMTSADKIADSGFSADGTYIYVKYKSDNGYVILQRYQQLLNVKILVYDVNNSIVNEYDLSKLSENLDIHGWIDLYGNYLYITNPTSDPDNFTVDNYRTGIAQNVDNAEAFDSIEYTDEGIMIVKFTDTIAEYNIRRYGIEYPSVNRDGLHCIEKHIYTEKNSPSDIVFEGIEDQQWLTPSGEIIAERMGMYSDVKYTDLYYEIQKGNYDPSKHSKAVEDVNTINAEGLIVVDDKLYYKKSDGSFAKGWITIGTSKYYFKQDGSAANKPTKIDGVMYRFDTSGICLGKYNGWTKTVKGFRYYRKGKMLIGRFRIKGKLYYFDENGYAHLRTK